MKPEIKKLLILNLPYLLFVWLFDKVGAAVRLSPGADASAKLLHLGDGFTTAFSSIAPSFHPADLLIGIAGAVIVRLIIYTKGKNAKKYRRGTEYGSARWGGADDIKPYTDPVFENNIPLTQTERLTMNSRPKQPKYARNKNILVIGGSGSGKTRFFVKPSLMQCTSKDFPTSYIVTDPKGTLILETGKMLQRYKYRIKVLNTINFKKSMKYNSYAMPSLRKKVLMFVSTTAAMNGKAWIYFPLSMKAQPSGQWRRKAYAPKRASSTAGSRQPMPLSGTSRRKSLSCSIGLPKQKRSLPSRRHPTLFLC
jgi:type IV secretion system protein VirD4